MKNINLLFLCLLPLLSFIPTKSMDAQLLIPEIKMNIWYACDEQSRGNWNLVSRDFHECYQSIIKSRKTYIEGLVLFQKKGKQVEFEHCIADESLNSTYARRSICNFLNLDNTLENNKKIYGNIKNIRRTILADAIKERSSLVTYLCIKQNIDALEIDENSAIVVAAMHGFNNGIVQFIDAGMSIESRKKGYNTALLEAVGCNYISTVKLLLDKGADVNAIGNFCRTPLCLAVQNIKPFAHSSDMIRILLDAGADPERGTDDYHTPLRMVESVVEKEIKNCTLFRSKHIPFNFQIRWALSAAGSDLELATCHDLIQKAINKKYFILGVHPGLFVVLGLPTLCFGIAYYLCER